MTLEEAISYLRSRGKYIVDADCKFKPTPHAATDVSKTIALYRKDMAKLESEIIPNQIFCLNRGK